MEGYGLAEAEARSRGGALLRVRVRRLGRDVGVVGPDDRAGLGIRAELRRKPSSGSTVVTRARRRRSLMGVDQC
jgi:hypothetical protein